MVESMWVGVGCMVECVMWVGGRLYGGVYVGGHWLCGRVCDVGGWSALWWSLCGWVVGSMVESMWMGVGSMVECVMWMGGQLYGGVYVGGCWLYGGVYDVGGWSALWWSVCRWVVGSVVESMWVGGRLYVRV